MTKQETFIALYTMVRKDVVRMFRIWSQTFLPSVITSVLYFLVFGKILGEHIASIDGVSYLAFIVPGLVMLSVITNSFSNTVFTFFTAKFFFRTIDTILVSPMSPLTIIFGYVLGGVLRGVLTGILVLLVALFFTALPIEHPFIIFCFLILTSLAFSLGGLINGVYAKGMDGISIVPTFVLTPLVYLGGVFYSVTLLPDFWKILTYLNPIFYLINGFRYGFVGFSDVSIFTSFAVIFGLLFVLFFISWRLLKSGFGLKQ